MSETHPGLQVRASIDGGETAVSTGLPVLDHLLQLLARYGGFGLRLEVAPGGADEEVAAAGRALGEALRPALHDATARGHGSGTVPADEALAHVAVEASGRPLVVSNVDLTRAHVGGLHFDVVARFLRELSEGAGLTLHVRLIEGDDAQHVLAAIFKSLGVALAQAGRPIPRKE
ncbi:MAG: imidazoleglycerol-phosphate dehydratase [Gaiellaceae bacterium]